MAARAEERYPVIGETIMGLLDKRTAMVTGASRGIGRAISVRFAREGANIVGCDIDVGPMAETEALVRQTGVEFLSLQLDVSNMQQFQEAVEKAVERFGTLDILVNNAGITRDNLLIRMSEDDWNKVIAINLTGVFNGVKAAAKVMLKQRAGSIINVSSVVGLMGNAGQVNYSASKAGVLGITKSAARELAKRGVRVNAVAPGYIVTRMTEQLSDEAKNALMQQIPMQRLGQPEDVANVILFLASDLSGYVTGQVISVDGGMAMH
jgi:3-oxoacyl-[acyl-carrier protein] reductase